MLTETAVFWAITGSMMVLGFGFTVGLIGYACLTSAEIGLRLSHLSEPDERLPIV